MAAESLQLDEERGNEESTIYLQEDEYEAEETLSFRDLPIYSSDSAQSDGFSKEDELSSSSCNNDDDGDGDDLFEFSRGELTASTLANAEKKSIVFCGKVIPYKEDSQEGLNFEGNPKLLRKTKNDSTFPYSLEKIKPYSVGKASQLMRSNSNTKSRWLLFMFGMSRLHADMELGDIRSRQRRKFTAAKRFPAAEQGDVVKSKGGRWGRMLRMLGSSRKCNNINDVVKGSFVGA